MTHILGVIFIYIGTKIMIYGGPNPLKALIPF